MATNNTMKPTTGTQKYVKNSEEGRWIEHMLFVEKIHPEILHEGGRQGCWVRDTAYCLLKKDEELQLNRLHKFAWKSLKEGIGRQVNAKLLANPELNVTGPYLPPKNQENPQVDDVVPAPVAEANVSAEDPTTADDDNLSNGTVDLTDLPAPTRKRKEIETESDLFSDLSPQIVKALEDSSVRTLLLQGNLCMMYPFVEQTEFGKESRLAVNYLLPSGTDSDDTSEAALNPRLDLKGKTLLFNLRVPKPFVATNVLTHSSAPYIGNGQSKKMRHEVGLEALMHGLQHLKSMDYGRIVSEVSIPLSEDCERIYAPHIVKMTAYNCLMMLHFQLKTKEQPHLQIKEAQKMRPNLAELKGVDASFLE